MMTPASFSPRRSPQVKPLDATAMRRDNRDQRRSRHQALRHPHWTSDRLEGQRAPADEDDMSRVASFGIALAGLGAAAAVAVPLVLHQIDDRNRSHFVAMAKALTMPSDAQRSTACHGEGTVACWTVNRPVTDYAAALAVALGNSARRKATQTCDRVPAGASAAPLQADACFVRVRFGDRGVFIFADPLTLRDADGVVTVIGSQVSATAS